MTDRAPVEGEMRDVMTTDQAAEYLGFKPYTIREKAKAGGIPCRKIDREWRFSRRALLAFIEGKEPAYAETLDASGEYVGPHCRHCGSWLEEGRDG